MCIDFCSSHSEDIGKLGEALLTVGGHLMEQEVVGRVKEHVTRASNWIATIRELVH